MSATIPGCLMAAALSALAGGLAPGALLLSLLAGCGEDQVLATAPVDPEDEYTTAPEEPVDFAALSGQVKVTRDAASYADPGPDGQAGFGATTRGALGGTDPVVVHVTAATDQNVRDAWSYVRGRKGHAVLVFDVAGPIPIQKPLPVLDVPFVTVEGRGATLDGIRFGTTTNALIDVRAHDVIVRNLRLRNAGDNLRAQTAAAYDIVFSHLSSTGAYDDGISIGYGAHDVTVQHCLLGGNTRSIFVKYGGTTNVSLHHNYLLKQWIRGPLLYGAMADLRNNVVEDWSLWGARFETSAARGNAVGNVLSLSAYAAGIGGKPRSALYTYNGATPRNIYTADNRYEDQAQQTLTGEAAMPLPAPPVPTTSAAAAADTVRRGAGCLPRDGVDVAYISATGWHTRDGGPLRL